MSESTYSVSPDILMQHAVRYARAAGDTALQAQQAGVSVADTKSSVNDVVTAADRASEETIVAAITADFPEHSILGEEGANKQGAADIAWIVDPIDGTVNFLYGSPLWCVSISAAVADESFQDGWRAIAGAVYCPRTGEMYAAYKGGGATCNGASISASAADSIYTSLVGTGFGYTVKRRSKQAAVLPDVIPIVRDIRRSGSAAYDLCCVANGTLDAYYEGGLNPWDYSAGLLIAAEAGATVTGSQIVQDRPGRSLVIAGSRKVVKDLKNLVDPAVAVKPKKKH